MVTEKNPFKEGYRSLKGTPLEPYDGNLDWNSPDPGLGPSNPGAFKSSPQQALCSLNAGVYTVNPRKLEHGFRRIGARTPYTLA